MATLIEVCIGRRGNNYFEGVGLLRKIRKLEVIEAIGEAGIVGIVRASKASAAAEMGRGMIDGGIRVLEVSLSFPGALNAMEQIVRENSGKDFVLGAGTVTDAASARMSILAGAEFVVSHCLFEDVVRTCNRYGIACSPGIQSVTEAVSAMEMGCEVVKVFPGSVLGPGFIKAVHGPVPNLEMIAVGGVSLDNLEEWFKAGAYAVGLGSSLTKKDGQDADYATVLEKSRNAIETVKSVRKS